MALPVQVTFDCLHPACLASFWASALHYKLEDPPDGYATWEQFLADRGIPEEEWDSGASVVDPDGVGPRIFFQRVPEPKAGKNRLHLDLGVSQSREVAADEARRRIDVEAARLVGLGATMVRAYEEGGGYWNVMTDPEGNEFCLH